MNYSENFINRDLLIKFDGLYDIVNAYLYKKQTPLMFWQKDIILADPFIPIGMKESRLISELSSVSFVLAVPILAG